MALPSLKTGGFCSHSSAHQVPIREEGQASSAVDGRARGGPIYSTYWHILDLQLSDGGQAHTETIGVRQSKLQKTKCEYPPRLKIRH